MIHWAFKGNLKLQIILLFVIIAIIGARVLPLEMQRRIINDAIALKNMNELVLYCGIYLLSVTAAGGLKLAVNYIQSQIGERAMLSMRKELYSHILTLPLGFFRKTQPGMVVSALMTELSAAGSFAGMAFAVPITNILTLLSFAVYLAWLNTPLALLTLAIYPIVSFVLPILQKKSNNANKERVDVARKVSSMIAESMTGIQEIQVHGAYQQEDRKFLSLIEKLKEIRIRWSLMKFTIKTTNNYFVSLGPFLIFIYGGFLVMNGQLELGAMVAFLSAQEKLYDPWKELIDFYQVYQDASIRYKRTMEYFDHEPEFRLEAPPVQPISGKGKLEIKGLHFETPEGISLLKGINLSLEAGQHMALVGFSGSGKSTLIQCIAKMYQHSSGSVLIDGEELSDISKNSLIEKMGYISQRPFIFTGTVLENLLYADLATRNAMYREDAPEPDRDQMILALQQAGFFADTMRFGLETVLAPEETDLIKNIINGRHEFRENYGEQLSRYVEFYDKEQYLFHSSLIENIIFGMPKDVKTSIKDLVKSHKIMAFFKENNLYGKLVDLGYDISFETVDLLEGLSNPELVIEDSPIPFDQLDSMAKIIAKKKNESLSDMEDEKLVDIALNFIPAIHTMTALSDNLSQNILKLRKLFRTWAKENMPDKFTFYNSNDYIHGQSLINNIFFGRPKKGMAYAQDKINQAIIQLLIEQDVLENVAEIGMRFEVGSSGDKLSGGQRQKLAIARVLLKNPSIVIMDEATSALDNASQTRIQRLIDTRWKKKRTVIAVIHRMDDIQSFDLIGVMKSGKLLETGNYQELIDKKGLFYELIHGKS